jgi:hypothetical protein
MLSGLCAERPASIQAPACGVKNGMLDFSPDGRFKFGEGGRFQLEARGESFNIINHVNFVGAIQDAGTGSAGATTMNTNLSSSAFGKALAAFDPRIIQLVLKVYF